MNKLVQIRTADAYESLGRIEAALKKATDRRAEAAALETDLIQLAFGARIAEIETLINYCTVILNQKSQSDWSEFQSMLTKGKQAFSVVKDRLLKLVETAGSLTQGSSNEEQLKHHDGKTKKLVEDKLRLLTDMEKKARLVIHTPPQLLKLLEEAKPMWAEHIETVAGMVLRDDQFDDGLCTLADHIATICAERFNTNPTLNILGRDKAITKDLNYALYFRFPDWSIWGLALIAHEFWHASSAEPSDVRNHLSSIPQAAKVWSEPLVQDCLADTFATYVMGPAYAFACILLSLDVNSPQDRVRARMVFSTLENLASDGGGRDYDFRHELQDCWDQATGSAQPSGACLLAQSSYSCHLVSNFAATFMTNTGQIPLGQPKMKCKLAEAPDECPMMDTRLIDKMHQVLLVYLGKLRYTIEIWRTVNRSLDEYLERESGLGAAAKTASSQKANLDKGVFSDADMKSLQQKNIDLRHVLHSAWLKRWDSLELDPNVIQRIGDLAGELCNKLSPRKEKAAVNEREGPM